MTEQDVEGNRINLTIGLTGILFTLIYLLQKYFETATLPAIILKALITMYSISCGFYFIAFLVVKAGLLKFKDNSRIGGIPISQYWEEYFYDSGVDMFVQIPFVITIILLITYGITKFNSIFGTSITFNKFIYFIFIAYMSFSIIKTIFRIIKKRKEFRKKKK